MENRANVISSGFYPNPPLSALKASFVGQRLEDLPVPAAVIDRAKVKQNCDAMLRTVKSLGVDFRAHVKTHKTVELTKLQVSDQLHQASGARCIKLVASTVAEIEHLHPFLTSAKDVGTEVDVILGLPPTHENAAQLLRLSANLQHAKLSRITPISVLIDDPAHLDRLDSLFPQVPGASLGILIKIDTGYHRAGVAPGSEPLNAILTRLERLLGSQPRVHFRGFYSHLGNSYGGNTPEDAIFGLITEIEQLEQATQDLKRHKVLLRMSNQHGKFILSKHNSSELSKLRNTIERVKSDPNYVLELHAGVYPLLDMQQVATHARAASAEPDLVREEYDRPARNPPPRVPGLSVTNIALRVLVESRPRPGTVQVLPRLGIVSPWTNKTHKDSGVDLVDFYNPDTVTPTGWIVGRVSQEHGILTHEGSREPTRHLSTGDKLLIWPNHACIAGAGFGWYVVVDSDSEDSDVVRDIWVRCRGW